MLDPFVVDDVPEVLGAGTAVAREQDRVVRARQAARREAGVNVSIGARQLSSALVEQLVEAPVVGVFAAPKTPRARLSEPYEVEM